MEETKVCFKCKRELPLSEFYKHPQMGDGHLNKCKDCTRQDVKKNYLKNSQSEEYMEKEQARGREKYHRLYVGMNTAAKIRKQKIFPGLRGARKRFGVTLDKNLELHHWDYKNLDSVFVLDRRLHRRLHKAITLNLEEGIYYFGQVKLDSAEKHERVIYGICDEYGFDKSRVKLLTR